MIPQWGSDLGKIPELNLSSCSPVDPFLTAPELPVPKNRLTGNLFHRNSENGRQHWKNVQVDNILNSGKRIKAPGIEKHCFFLFSDFPDRPQIVKSLGNPVLLNLPNHEREIEHESIFSLVFCECPKAPAPDCQERVFSRKLGRIQGHELIPVIERHETFNILPFQGTGKVEHGQLCFDLVNYRPGQFGISLNEPELIHYVDFSSGKPLCFQHFFGKRASFSNVVCPDKKLFCGSINGISCILYLSNIPDSFRVFQFCYQSPESCLNCLPQLGVVFHDIGKGGFEELVRNNISV